MKVFYSIASVQGPDHRKNTGDFFINGAVRLPEYETLKYSSISIRELQLYAVTEEEGAQEGASLVELLGKYDSPDFFRRSEEFLEAASRAADVRKSEFALLSLTNGRLLAAVKGGASVFLIRGGEIVLLQPEESSAPEGVPFLQDESHPEDLYILCTGGLTEFLSKEEICRIAIETDRIQEIANALATAAADAGCEAPVTVLAVRRES